ncbi:DUF302 domain-containing protein (plasmid) [Polymorphobacter sp. PAMC 29334]|uniref:DUF302 domain-containing protein n=1 Tax=Polymorphobacter sp. PAMC 29334 TaxID=2862331 RepID=UPI001C6788E9|nr:DUF302 domain-containing protein [Polymorphobacter sp. PAMC 29334]QYE33315.1 DUF302 domain-containing protein [Polymorphobacter sp. PAMC 29334]
MVIRRCHDEGAVTAQRLRKFVEARGLTVFACIEHDAAAREVDLQLPFTQVLIFGSPRTGTPLMRAVPTVALDLPLRVLVWEDATGDTWLGYDDPNWVAARHSMLPAASKAIEGMRALLALASDAAAGASG